VTRGSAALFEFQSDLNRHHAQGVQEGINGRSKSVIGRGAFFAMAYDSGHAEGLRRRTVILNGLRREAITETEAVRAIAYPEVSE